MTNAEKIIALLSKSPGLDDDEISSHANIRPRQQVNQICKRLELKGQISRVRGPRGKIVNYLTGSLPNRVKSDSEETQVHRQSIDLSTATRAKPSVRKKHIDSIALDTINSLDLRRTLILIPCSGKKAVNTKGKSDGPSILDFLPKSLSEELKVARNKMAETSQLDESSLLPAWMRYEGMLYQIAQPDLEIATEKGRNILIISGGYGLVLANEPIGDYKQVFKYSNWPEGLLEKVLLSYIWLSGIKNVVAIVSASTAYRTLLDRINWSETSQKYVFLMTPESSTGAMVKAPRAQGEALSALLNGTLSSSFVSSDGLKMEVQNKMGN